MEEEKERIDGENIAVQEVVGKWDKKRRKVVEASKMEGNKMRPK